MVKTVLYDKKIDKWWDLFDDRINLNVCIDEVHPKCSLTFFHNLKTWSDFRPFIADVKEVLPIRHMRIYLLLRIIHFVIVFYRIR